MTRGWMGARNQFDLGDEDGDGDYFANLSWKCDICGMERPDARISIHKVDFSGPHLPPGTAIRNVKYCNDKPSCKEGAEKWQGVER